ncbi:hypothetical protein [Aeromonas sp. QDB12]|uniref:hypothetical protein n=1 Tax=Aeromonas sp. QDB12 TaxID=2990483 RepID=UPI0022DFA0CB|nr:hypothetical protein [Aeromonas sp. QDB12]
MKHLLLALTLISSQAIAINWDAINQSKVQAYHQLVADLEREERLKQAEKHSKPVEMIHDSYRMEACLERLDKSYGNSDLHEINYRVNQCSKEARIPLEQYEREMEQRYMNEQ